MLEPTPSKDIKYYMNNHVEGFVYSAGLLHNNIECGVCNNCKKSGKNDCEKYTLF